MHSFELLSEKKSSKECKQRQVVQASGLVFSQSLHRDKKYINTPADIVIKARLFLCFVRFCVLVISGLFVAFV